MDQKVRRGLALIRPIAAVEAEAGDGGYLANSASGVRLDQRIEAVQAAIGWIDEAILPNRVVLTSSFTRRSGLHA